MTLQNLVRRLPVFVLALLAPLAADAAERGTAEEAQAMVADAIAAYDATGAAVLFGRINETPRPEFFDGDLYIFVVDEDGLTVAHAAEPTRVGSDVTRLTDVDGKAFGTEMLAVATPEGAWVDYKWQDPATGEVEPKASWVVRHDGYIFGCGIYLATDG